MTGFIAWLVYLMGVNHSLNAQCNPTAMRRSVVVALLWPIVVPGACLRILILGNKA